MPHDFCPGRRECATPNGCLPRPYSVLVLKKLGEVLVEELVELANYLIAEEDLVVVLEQAAYAQVAKQIKSPKLCTFIANQTDRYGHGPSKMSQQQPCLGFCR